MKKVRALLVDKRRWFANNTIELEEGGDQRWASAAASLVGLHSEIEAIDRAIADEEKLARSNRESVPL